MKTKSTISTVLNIVIFILMIFGAIVMFTGFKFMHGEEVALESTKLGTLKFFTFQSNVFMGIVALLLAIRKNHSTTMYVWKLIATGAVSLTFVIVFGDFWLVLGIPIMSMLQNGSLFYHLIIPVLSIITFVVFERTDKIKFRFTFMGLIPTFLYAIFYAIVVFTHVENGVVPKRYDWYGFTNAGIYVALAVIPGMLILTFIICLLLWLANRKRNHT